ncbi:hypothetical protein B0T24DRAFT_621824 [Lasiosphaeria ovina]|uniref:Secreted protein n=1 Tax=Lasiosphaeria ovina TaxID=92902 RepID=A0AAE0N7C8_9PEZI|nr:hypothetical protein B0T24DRAFT_621824 [Lasiosphaeria ovina]
MPFSFVVQLLSVITIRQVAGRSYSSTKIDESDINQLPSTSSQRIRNGCTARPVARAYRGSKSKAIGPKDRR